ncbi:MAG: iron chaperone [Terriglobales bacterium]
MKSAKKSPPSKSRRRPAAGKKTAGFTAEERAAMRDRVQELRADQGDGESAVRAKLAALPPADRAIGERLHTLIRATAPELEPKTWYGMPAYARDGQVVCFFQSAHKFKTRYATLGFSDKARFDEGRMWPTTFALVQLTPVEEAAIVALVKKALG